MHTGNMTKTAARKSKVIETRLTVTPVIAVSADAMPLFMSEDRLVDKVSVPQPKPF